MLHSQQANENDDLYPPVVGFCVVRWWYPIAHDAPDVCLLACLHSILTYLLTELRYRTEIQAAIDAAAAAAASKTIPAAAAVVLFFVFHCRVIWFVSIKELGGGSRWFGGGLSFGVEVICGNCGRNVKP